MPYSHNSHLNSNTETDDGNASSENTDDDANSIASSENLSISDQDGGNFYKPSYDSTEAPLSDDQLFLFPNFTIMALSIYLRISKTSKKDFSSLLKILRSSSFNQQDLPRSYKACRQHLRKIDSLPIRIHKAPIKTTNEIIEVHDYSIKDILHRALSTPSLVSAMYFGPAVKVKKPKEFWHGTLWRQSPLFGEDMVNVDGKPLRLQYFDGCLMFILFVGRQYWIGEFVKYDSGRHGAVPTNGRIVGFFINETLPQHPIQATIEPLHGFDSLPSHLWTEELDRNAIFLDEETVEIDITKLLGHINCQWPNVDASNQDDLHESTNSKTIGGILYRHPATNQYEIRDTCLRRILPTEIYRPTPAPPTLETLKIFLDLYYDDFGAYRNAYHSVGGVYVVLGNLPLEMRQKLRNIFLVGFVPPVVTFDDFIKPFVNELQELQNGIRMSIGGKDYWVIAGKFFFIFEIQ